MNRTQKAALVIAFAVSLLAVGVPYWQIPYADVALPNSILNSWLFAPFLAAALLRAINLASFWHAVLAIGITAPCAILLRVLSGIAADPTSHNLWPFEVILGCVVGLAVSLCGALFGSGVLLLQGRRNTP
jgi:hypothetical protein